MQKTSIQWTDYSWNFVRGCKRVSKKEWFDNIIYQCRFFNVPIFIKQLGARYCDSTNMIAGKDLRGGDDYFFDNQKNYSWERLRDSKGGKLDEWTDDLKIMEFP